MPVQNTVPQNGGYVRRKIIKPIQIAAPTFTTTTTELPRVIEGPAENALNRSQDDPRCKNYCMQCYQLYYTYLQFFLQFYHYLPSSASKTMLVSPEPEITGRVTVLPIVPNLEERPLVRVRRDLESAVYVSPILRVYFTFSREIYVIPLWTVHYHLFVDEF